MIRLKHLVFRYLTPLVVAAGSGLLAATYYLGATVEWPVTLSGVSIGLGLIYFVQKQKLDELRLFTDLFREFNGRYNELNEELADIASRLDDRDLDEDEEKILVDYFNLCGEEYLYYQQGYIFPQVWNAWLNGMRHYCAVPHIRKFWVKELQEGSYYGLTPEHLGNYGQPELLRSNFKTLIPAVGAE